MTPPWIARDTLESGSVSDSPSEDVKDVEDEGGDPFSRRATCFGCAFAARRSERWAGAVVAAAVAAAPVATALVSSGEGIGVDECKKPTLGKEKGGALSRRSV